MKTVGILGGGQLGLMLANSIYTLGGRTIIYDPDPDSPACKHTNEQVNGSWQDYDLIKTFVEKCDVITYEFENVEVPPLRPIAKISPIYPSLDVLETTQNRISEKTFVKQSALPHVQFESVNSIAELDTKAATFKMPFVIKLARGGYDGKGQFLVKDSRELKEACNKLANIATGEFQAVLEEFVPLHAEVSCIVARETNGNYKTFPTFENSHKNHILDTTVVPANLPKTVLDKVEQIAVEAAVKLNIHGLLTTEFFITKNDGSSQTGTACGDYRIYINEFAPRPHNSGHITRNACHMSQFDALARILLNIPLGLAELNSSKYHCMINILGETFLAQDFTDEEISCYPELNLSPLKDDKNISEVVLYGKKEARKGRKMGHLSAFGETFEAAKSNAQRAKEALSTEP